MPWTLPHEVPTASAPTPAPTLAKLVKAPAGRLLGLVLGQFKLISPGGAVIPFTERETEAQRDLTAQSDTARVVGVQSLCTSHPYPLYACTPYTDTPGFASESDSPSAFSPVAFSFPDQDP